MNATEQFDIDEILRHLYSPARAKMIRDYVIVKAVEKGLTDDPEHIKIAMRQRMREHEARAKRLSEDYKLGGKNEYVVAAKIAIQIHDTEEAIRLYRAAIELFYGYSDVKLIREEEGLEREVAGLVKQSGKALEIIQSYPEADRQGRFFYALSRNVADLYLESDTETAIEIALTAGLTEDAADYAEQSGAIDRAIGIYTSSSRFGSAGDVAKRAGRTEQAIELYEQANDFEKAAEVAQQIGDGKRKRRLLRRAVTHNVKEGDFQHAVTLAEEMKDSRKAQQIRYKQIDALEAEGNFHGAARIAEKIGDYERASQLYEEMTFFAVATKCAYKAGNTERAGVLGRKAMEEYESISNFRNAGEIARMLGDTQRAQAYETLERLLH